MNPRVINGQLEVEPSTESEDEQISYARHYMPIRYAGPLTTKLKKRYWERDNVTGLPLVFAIQDFHEPRSMSWSGSSLPIYLYGVYHEAVTQADGTVAIEPRTMSTHEWGTKTVPSNFFALPDSEHVSAVIHNGSGTLSKFNRMGVSAGFGLPNVHLFHMGLLANPDPNALLPTEFRFEVTGGYEEAWVTGMNVYHNPFAAKPIDFDAFPGAAHHVLQPNGTLRSTVPKWHPLSSFNAIVAAT